MRSDRKEFSHGVKERAWKRCGGYCEHPACGQKIHSGAVYDHYPIAAALGGEAILGNCRVLCARCNRYETPRDQTRIAKSKRIDAKRGNLKPKSRWASLADLKRIIEAKTNKTEEMDT